MTCRCRCGTPVPASRAFAPGHNAATQARWAGHDPTKPSSECLNCGTGMVSHAAWKGMSTEDRRAADFTRRGANGLCERCYKAGRRAKDPVQTRSPYRRREEMLEEWEFLRSDGVTDLSVAASRMGVTRTALEKALERARKAGDPRGVHHRNADLGGYGSSNTGSTATRRWVA